MSSAMKLPSENDNIKYKVNYMDGSVDEYLHDSQTYFVTVNSHTGMVIVSYKEDPMRGMPQPIMYIPPANIKTIDVFR